WRWRRGWFLMGTRSGQPRSVRSVTGVHRIPPMRETNGGDGPRRQDQAPPRSAAGGIAGGAHHPWAARIHFHRLIIKHVSIWFSFPFSKILFQIPCLALPPPCPARPFDLFFSELFSFSTCRLIVMYCLDSDKRLIRFTACEVYGTETGSLLSKDHPLRKVPVELLQLKRR
ncbi:hypothetical protein BHM03_00061558, partial [Ensete ventricosum]